MSNGYENKIKEECKIESAQTHRARQGKKSREAGCPPEGRKGCPEADCREESRKKGCQSHDAEAGCKSFIETFWEDRGSDCETCLPARLDSDHATTAIGQTPGAAENKSQSQAVYSVDRGRTSYAAKHAAAIQLYESSCG